MTINHFKLLSKNFVESISDDELNEFLLENPDRFLFLHKDYTHKLRDETNFECVKSCPQSIYKIHSISPNILKYVLDSNLDKMLISQIHKLDNESLKLLISLSPEKTLNLFQESFLDNSYNQGLLEDLIKFNLSDLEPVYNSKPFISMGENSKCLITFISYLDVAHTHYLKCYLENFKDISVIYNNNYELVKEFKFWKLVEEVLGEEFASGYTEYYLSVI